jgi:hypothetical protein
MFGRIQWLRGTQNLLDCICRSGSARGLCAADLVGAGRDHPHRLRQLVGSVSE